MYVRYMKKCNTMIKLHISTGCPVKLFPLGYLLFCQLLLIEIAKVGTIQEICYIIGTKILKIDLEIAEIIEVKVGFHHLEIDILLLHRGRKKNLC